MTFATCAATSALMVVDSGVGGVEDPARFRMSTTPTIAITSSAPAPPRMSGIFRERPPLWNVKPAAASCGGTAGVGGAGGSTGAAIGRKASRIVGIGGSWRAGGSGGW